MNITVNESEQSGNNPGGALQLGVTSGTERVSLGLSDQIIALQTGRTQRTSLHITLTPEQAERLARALLRSATNVRAGVWGGPNDDEPAESALGSTTK